MTNAMRFTPPENRWTHRGTIATAGDIALRGNMPRVLEHAANGQSKVGLHRREIVRQVRESRPAIVRKYKPRGISELHPRQFAVARITRKPSLNGFHVVGLGDIPHTNLDQLKTRLGLQGFTKFRFGNKPIQKLFA